MPTLSWFLDELAHAGKEHLDATYVPDYDRKAGTDPTEDLALFRALGVNQTHTVVDLGTGTGIFALAVAAFCRRVIAIDVSPVMLARLRQKAASLGIANIVCVQRGFLTYEHQGDLADFIYSRHALHHLPDFWKAIALQHLTAILNPGGILYLRDPVFSCEPHEIEPVIEAWLASAPEQSAYGWTRPELETHICEEYSTFNWLIEPMIEHAGFHIQQADHADSKVYSAYTCIKIA